MVLTYHFPTSWDVPRLHLGLALVGPVLAPHHGAAEALHRLHDAEAQQRALATTWRWLAAAGRGPLFSGRNLWKNQGKSEKIEGDNDGHSLCIPCLKCARDRFCNHSSRALS